MAGSALRAVARKWRAEGPRKKGLPTVVTAQPRQRCRRRPEHECVCVEALPQGIYALLRPGFNGLFAGAAPAEDD